MAKTYQSDVTIEIEGTMLSTRGGLVPIKDTSGDREMKMVMVCPSCRASRVDQQYVCRNGCKPGPTEEDAGKPGWRVGNIPDRAKPEGKDGIGTVLNEEEIEALGGAKLEKNTLSLEVVHAAQVEAGTWPNGTAYWFEPEKGGNFYEFLCQTLAKPGLALVGMMNLRGNDKMYRLMPHGSGGFVVQELIRPEQLNQFAKPEGELSDKQRKMGETFVEALLDDFDVDAYHSDRLDRFREVMAAKAGGTIVPISAARPEKKADDNLEAQMAAAIAAAKAAKAAKNAQSA